MELAPLTTLPVVGMRLGKVPLLSGRELGLIPELRHGHLVPVDGLEVQTDQAVILSLAIDQDTDTFTIEDHDSNP